jgi:hypothetical protein
MDQIKEGQVKVIIVIRNPKDTLVSYYNFYRMWEGYGKYRGTWDEFFDVHQSKLVSYGNYFDWYESWLPLISLPNVLLVKYEDMKSALPDVLARTSTFLGKAMPSDVRYDLIQHLSFESMKQNDMTNYRLLPGFDYAISPFMRKGKVGDWKNYFSQDQAALIDRAYKERIERLGVTLRFE